LKGPAGLEDPQGLKSKILNDFSPVKNPRTWRWLMLAVFLLALAARLLAGPRTIDDAFITFRYARDLLAGNGFVYNAGERVLGTTTPLYTLLMGLLGSLTGGVQAPFPSLALWANALADGITCVLLASTGRRLGYLWAGLGAALVWAIAPYSVTFAIGGLETSLYVLWLVAMMRLHLDNRHIATAFVAALALLTRPDALILIGPLVLDRIWQVTQNWRGGKGKDSAQTDQKQIRHPLLFEALAFLVPTLAWITFASAYFGSPLPHSMAAKSLAYRLPPEAGFIRLLQHYATPFLEEDTFGRLGIAAGFVLYPFLFLIGALGALRATRRIWPFLAYPWLYFAAFALSQVLIFRWYLTPPLPFYMLFILIGAQRLVSEVAQALAKRTDPHIKAGRAWQAGKITMSALALFVVLAPLGLSLRDWQIHPDHGLDRPAPEMAWYKLELLYRQAADLLAPEMAVRGGKPPLLAAGDVGVLGFYTPARILDTVGLNSPQSTRYYPLDPAYYVINYAIPPDLILDERPDYVVILEVYGREGLLKDPRFWASYSLRQKIPTDIYGSDGLLILERKP